MATMMIILGVVLMVVFCALTAFATYAYLQISRAQEEYYSDQEAELIDTHAECFNEYLDELRPINKNKAE